MLDRYIEGQTERVSPEAPVPVVRVTKEWSAVGGAGNVAANVRALGARCDLIGVTGSDEAGGAVQRTLEALGVGCDFVYPLARPTTVKTRVLAQGQQVVRVDREEDTPHSAAVSDILFDRLRSRLEGAGVVILADYDKGVLSAPLARRTLEAASSLGIPVVVDPKRRHFFAYGGATVFKPNRSELEAALGEPARPDSAKWMAATRRRIGCEHLLLTLGPAGMALSSPGGTLESIRVRARSVYDVSGAGDTVSAVLAVALAAGAEIAESVQWAAHAAAAGVAAAGVATVTPTQIEASLDSNPHSPTKQRTERRTDA